MERIAEIQRITKETEIRMKLNLDGKGQYNISTGIGFFDHMLQQVAVHGRFDIELIANGDLHVDDHHIIEDIGIVFGSCLYKALGEKKGINRYGFFVLPMDETLVLTSIDLSRPFLNFQVEFNNSFIGTLNTQMIEEFFLAFCNNAKLSLHVLKLAGRNDHHICEAIFKSFAKSIKMAVSFTDTYDIPSSKGVL